MRARLHSTSARLVLAVSAAFLAAFLLLGAGIYSSVLASLDNDTREFVRSDSSELLDLDKRAGRTALLAEVGKRISDPDDADLLYAVVDAHGRRLAGAPLPVNLHLHEAWAVYRDPAAPDHARVLARVTALPGHAWLVAGMRTRAEDGFLSIMQRATLVALAVAAVLGLLVGWLTSRWVGARLARLDDTARRIAAGELGLRVLADGSGDPFDRLGARMNAMLDRIDTLMDGVRQVTDHIAHDLRTPLTRLHNRLDAMRAMPAPVDADALDAALAETAQLLQTFGALLRLSRIEAQGQVEGAASVDLARIAGDAVELYAPGAAESGVRLLADCRAARLRGDAHQLFQVVVNLLDNALKYAAAGGEVIVLTGVVSDGVVLEVRDRGPGIPIPEHERMFERFQRLEPHRGSPGNGLGLSLVRAIVSCHGGRVELRDNHPGLCVRAVFAVPSQGAVS